MEIQFQNIFLDMDWLGRHFDMINAEFDSAWKLYGAMPEGAEKEYVCQTLKSAKKGLSEAWGDFLKIESAVVLGVEVSVMKFRYGDNGKLEKPFPLIKTEKGLDRMVEGLVGSFKEVDRGIEKVAEEGGLCIRKCNDAAGWNLWEDGIGNTELFGILCSMLSLEQLFRQTYDIGENIFRRVDSLRPKAHCHMKKAVFATGFYWEGRLKKDFLEMQSLNMPENKPIKSVKIKPSLRERMKAAEDSSLPLCADSHEKRTTEIKER